MKLVLEKDVSEPEAQQRLISIAELCGIEVFRAEHVPFEDFFRLSDLPLDDKDGWFYGSIQGAKIAQATTKWQVHAPWTKLSYSYQLTKIGSAMLNSRCAHLRLSNLKDIFHSCWEFVEDDTLFVRPDSADKLFDGGCVSRDTLNEQIEIIKFYNPPEDTPIIVASPKRIYSEIRILIVNRRMITASYYKIGRQSIRVPVTDKILLSQLNELVEFCAANGYNPAPSWVLDIGNTTEGLKILETGATACCGLYECDLISFLKALKEQECLSAPKV